MAILISAAHKSSLEDAIEYGKNPEKTILEDAIEYGKNPEKTKKQLCSSINCSLDTAAEEMIVVKKQYNKLNGRSYYHFKQSFDPQEDVSPAEVHQIGVELAKKLWGNDFQVVICTHMDKPHLHNHIYINSVAFSDGHKLHYNHEEFKSYRKENDRICKAHGLSTIKNNRYQGKSYKKYLEGKRETYSVRDGIKIDIDACIEKANSISSFYINLEKMGYAIKAGKHFAISPPGAYKQNGNRQFFRLDSLNDEKYTKEGIEQRIRAKHTAQKNIPLKKAKNKRMKRVHVPFPLRTGRLGHYLSLYYRFMFLSGLFKEKPAYRRLPAASVIKAGKNIDGINRQLYIIHKYNLKDVTDLHQTYKQIKAKLEEVMKSRDYLRGKQKNEQSEDISSKIQSYTKEIRDLRNEMKTMEQIKIKTEQLEWIYKDILNMDKSKGGKIYARSPSSRSIREFSK